MYYNKIFFHWVKVLWGNMKNNGYTEINNLSKTKIVLFNVKILAFIYPKLIKKFYNLIISEYGDKYEKFFKFFEKNWIKKKKLGKYILIFNYYTNLKGPDFNKKFLFLTNNISESINHILNSFFKSNYPNFSDWSNSILQTLELFENKNNEIKRINYTSVKLDKIHENNINNLSNNSISRFLNLCSSADENKKLDSQFGIRINPEINILPNSDELILSDNEELNCLNDDLIKLNLDEIKILISIWCKILKILN